MKGFLKNSIPYISLILFTIGVSCLVYRCAKRDIEYDKIRRNTWYKGVVVEKHITQDFKGSPIYHVNIKYLNSNAIHTIHGKEKYYRFEVGDTIRFTR